MRILLVGNHHRPVGGAETVLLLTERLLREAGHEVLVLAVDEPGELAPPDPAGRLRPPPAGSTARTEVGRRVAATWSRPAAAAVRKLVAGWRPDVAHVHHVYESLSLSVVDALHRLGVPVVLTLHDYRPVCPNYRLFRAGRPCDRCLDGGRSVNVARLRCLEGPWVRSAAAAAEAALADRLHVYDRVAAFVAPSRFLRDRVVAGGLPADRVVVLPNPVEPAEPRRRPPHPPRFGFVGRLVDEKGIDVLLSAAALLPPEMAVDVYGAGRLCADVRARVRAERLPVTVHGRLPAERVAATLRRTTAAVLPALWPENCPMALLEAAACGVPSIASAVGGIPEIVADGRTGVLVPPGDPAALAAAMTTLGADHALATRLGAAARARVLAAHSPADHLNALLDVLDGAALDRRRRGTAGRAPARAGRR